MKKKYHKKPKPQKDIVRGAFDKSGKWWFEQEHHLKADFGIY
jgi:hypothetical protein